METNMSTSLTLITGDHGSGKTGWCERKVLQARAADREIAGLLSPAVFEDGLKIGIELLDLASGERRPLASLRGSASSGLMTADWLFEPETLAWGNQRLSMCGRCDVFILDELGPLEFHRNTGLLEGFYAIERGLYRQAYVVIRPKLLPLALTRWPHAQVLKVKSMQQGNYDPHP
jgi:nucleoside-triphosphatase THEP1